jgi:tetratricopeptide (TPR) repeat protein
MTRPEAPPPSTADDPAADLELMRAATLLPSDPAAVVRRASAILEQFPQNEAASLLLATACRRLGDPANAVTVLESLAQAHAESAAVQLELGRAYSAAGRHAQAIAACQRAVEIDARLADAWQVLAAQRFVAGDISGGDTAYAQYERYAAPRPELSDAVAAIADGRADLAVMLLQRRLDAAPEDVVAMRMLANAVNGQGDFVAAERYLLRCLQLAPGYAAARQDLATELARQQRHDEALPHVERLLTTDALNPSYIMLKADSLRFYGRVEEALTLVQQGIGSNPQNAHLRLYHGLQLRNAGDQSGAIAAFRQALAIEPGMGEAYQSLADLKTLRFSDADITAMQNQLERTPPTAPGRAELEFALGKALEDAGQYAQSFEHYARGNAIVRASISYRPEVLRGGLRRSRELYTPRFFAERAGWGSGRTDPIFIVGMPRSGSTLVEQILASHSQIEGTMELPELPAIARELMLRTDPYAEADYPRPVGELSREQVAAYAERYIERTALHRSLGTPRFVDKMGGNFDNIGLIQLLLPKATIIDVRRHPLGCCFSCFRQMFGRQQYFSYDQEELGRYYLDYCEMMAHIDVVLPGRVHRLYYEQLVADPENVVRRLLEHCGLPFEAGCLKFYENKRVVTTISSEQVRRPISSDAVDQWRHFEPWLGTLKQNLGDLIERYPTFPARTA